MILTLLCQHWCNWLFWHWLNYESDSDAKYHSNTDVNYDSNTDVNLTKMEQHDDVISQPNEFNHLNQLKMVKKSKFFFHLLRISCWQWIPTSAWDVAAEMWGRTQKETKIKILFTINCHFRTSFIKCHFWASFIKSKECIFTSAKDQIATHLL